MNSCNNCGISLTKEDELQGNSYFCSVCWKFERKANEEAYIRYKKEQEFERLNYLEGLNY